MKIDFEKSHPAMNMDDKVACYKGFVHVSVVVTILCLLLMLFLFIFRT